MCTLNKSFPRIGRIFTNNLHENTKENSSKTAFPTRDPDSGRVRQYHGNTFSMSSLSFYLRFDVTRGDNVEEFTTKQVFILKKNINSMNSSINVQ